MGIVKFWNDCLAAKYYLLLFLISMLSWLIYLAPYNNIICYNFYPVSFFDAVLLWPPCRAAVTVTSRHYILFVIVFGLPFHYDWYLPQFTICRHLCSPQNKKEKTNEKCKFVPAAENPKTLVAKYYLLLLFWLPCCHDWFMCHYIHVILYATICIQSHF